VPVPTLPAARPLPADAVADTGLDATINDWFATVSDPVVATIFFSVPVLGADLPLIVVWLVVAAVFFTIWTGFLNIRGFGHALALVRGRYSDPKDAGEVSHFQALATAVSGTVGLGNIAGVAVAITLGGPGATFWMIVAGFLGMSTKLVECTLGVKYRRENADGSVSGGPMYYLSRGLAERGMARLGKVLAVVFAICCIGGSLGGGNMFQSNQATAQIIAVTGAEDSPLAGQGVWIGLAFAVLVGVVIIGGIKSIARVTDKLVPFMAALYLGAALVVIAFNLDAVPGAFQAILSGAFTPEGVAGGFVGVLIQGFRRAAFSNEAGVGSAAIAHSAVRTKEPATEGHVALLEPFIDTVVICTMTALVIVITGTYTSGEAEGVALTSDAFATVIPWFPVVLAVAVVLFAYSTMLAWSYYGMKATRYLFRDSAIAENVFKIVFCVFTVIGAAATLGPVIDFSDSMIFAMSLPNIIGLYLLAGVVKRELAQYRTKLRNREIVPVAERVDR
jgi:alanine or glycine:cation symporter, AGCS family